MFIRHRRWENSALTTHNSTANVRQPLTIFFSDMEPLSHYSPVLLHLSPAARILTENPEVACSVFVARFSVALVLCVSHLKIGLLSYFLGKYKIRSI